MKAKTLKVKELKKETIQEMYALYQRYYLGTSFSVFSEDLAEKTAVILLFKEKKLVGFSLLLVYKNKSIKILYSGDTIISKEYWGSLTLSQAWLEYAGQVKTEEPEVPLYWLLLTKGQRTYRYLTLYFKEYFPKLNKEQLGLKKLCANLAQEKFGNKYKNGIVCFPDHAVSLKESFDNTGQRLSVSRDISDFIKLNPGYQRGDELVCLAEISTDNLIKRTHQFFESRLKR